MRNTNFTYRLVSSTYGTDIYEVDNIEGMTKDEIIDACDPCNFGGVIYGKTVRVYTD